MNIVFVLPQLKTGGGVRVIVELANILVQKHQVSIIVPNTLDSCSFDIDKKISIQKIGKKPKNKLQKIKNMLKLPYFIYKTHKKSTIIITDPIQSLLFLPYRFKSIFRFVQADDYRIFDDLMLLKNRVFLTIYKVLTKLSYKKKMTYFFNSNYTYERFVQIKNEFVPKLIVHPSINHKYFFPKTKDIKDKVNIALITRVHPIKRFQDFIDAYKLLAQKEKQMIEDIFIITQDDLSSFELFDFKVIKPKNDKEIADIFRKSDIFVFSSLWEGFGLPPLEAMGCGCAVITSDAKGVNEYAKDQKNALIYPPKDTDALKRCLTTLINDKELLKKLQKNAILTAKEFSWEKSAKQLENILEGSHD